MSIEPLDREEMKTFDRVVYESTSYRMVFRARDFWLGTSYCVDPAPSAPKQ